MPNPIGCDCKGVHFRKRRSTDRFWTVLRHKSAFDSPSDYRQALGGIVLGFVRPGPDGRHWLAYRVIPWMGEPNPTALDQPPIPGKFRLRETAGYALLRAADHA